MRGKCSCLSAVCGPRTCWRRRVSLVSSLSLRLLEQCKVCLFKTTPLSLCQKKINAVHKATFYLTLLVFFFPQIIFVCVTWPTKRYSYLISWISYLFGKVFCAKCPLWKKCDYIPAQISSLLHVYKCVCTVVWKSLISYFFWMFFRLKCFRSSNKSFI